MGESSCALEDFSLASQTSTSQRMAGALSALGESVSFGRFLTESLDWGRWSSFNQRKYIEEAERYSQPGSVAQKKALFEARYKKAAHLRRSVACMEYTALSPFNEESEVDCCSKGDSVSRGRDESTIDSFYSANGDSVNFELREEVGSEEEVNAGRVIEDSGFLDSCSTNIVTSSTPAKQPLQESSVSNQQRNDFTEKIPRSPNLETTKIPKPLFSPSPRATNKASHLHRTKENIPSSSRVACHEGNSVERKRPTQKFLHMSVDQSIGGTSTPSKADIKTKIARFEAASKTSQSSGKYSKAAKFGFPSIIPKLAPQTPQSEPRKTALERSSFSGRKSSAAEYCDLSAKNSRVASYEVDRLQGESSVSVSCKSERKDKKKDMTATELRELRSSFKARPLPVFYSRKEPVKESKEKKPPLSRSSSRNSIAAPTVASFSKDQHNRWTFSFSRR
ncbi:TPX2 (targeting protein for Xklp2) protein family [Rhynchospora pubera]|uniref:TPX2 (Targeting protein for Xklp2) protein family n=1 Tax=Rhynchospora pubera TaxID=906938 RepID=A0AAV8DE91_9POAL|nr:TPX2 (targeting protein for Xklp2) protein family [Rhynchospora pubera]